jgi:hypothetical protein
LCIEREQAYKECKLNLFYEEITPIIRTLIPHKGKAPIAKSPVDAVISYIKVLPEFQR